MTTYYKVIEVKDINDLPIKNDNYFFHLKDEDKIDEGLFNPKDPLDISFAMDCWDYYLQPIEQIEPDWDKLEKECLEYGKKSQVDYHAFMSGVNYLKTELKDKAMGDRWIEIEDSIPKHDATILVHTKGGKNLCSIFKERRGFMIYDISEDDLELIEQVTHWMPLPNKPTNF